MSTIDFASDPAPTGDLTEQDLANRFAANGGQTDGEAAHQEQAAGWLDANSPASTLADVLEAAPAQPQVDVQAAIEAGVQQHLAALSEQFALEQQAEAERQAFLGDPSDPTYWDRFQQLQTIDAMNERIDAITASIEERYRPLAEYVATEQAAAVEALAAETTAGIFDEETEQLGEFDRFEAYSVAEELAQRAQQDLFARGFSPEQAWQLLQEANFAEAAVRAGARYVAERDGVAAPTAPAFGRGSGPDEAAVSRSFIDRLRSEPRSPGEAVRHAELERRNATTPAAARQPTTGLRPPDLHRAPTSEAEAARMFIDRRRYAAA